MRGLGIADDRAMARAAHHMRHIGLTFDGDGFGAGVKGLPPGGRFVARGIAGVDLL